MKTLLFILTAVIVLDSCAGWSATDIRTPDWAVLSQNIATQRAPSNQIRFIVGDELKQTSGCTIRPFLKGFENKFDTGLHIAVNKYGNKGTSLPYLNSTMPCDYPFSGAPWLSGTHRNYKPDYTGDLFYSYSFVSGAFNRKK